MLKKWLDYKMINMVYMYTAQCTLCTVQNANKLNVEEFFMRFVFIWSDFIDMKSGKTENSLFLYKNIFSLYSALFQFACQRGSYYIICKFTKTVILFFSLIRFTFISDFGLPLHFFLFFQLKFRAKKNLFYFAARGNHKSFHTMLNILSHFLSEFSNKFVAKLSFIVFFFEFVRFQQVGCGESISLQHQRPQ